MFHNLFHSKHDHNKSPSSSSADKHITSYLISLIKSKHPYELPSKGQIRHVLYLMTQSIESCEDGIEGLLYPILKLHHPMRSCRAIYIIITILVNIHNKTIDSRSLYQHYYDTHNNNNNTISNDERPTLDHIFIELLSRSIDVKPYILSMSHYLYQLETNYCIQQKIELSRLQQPPMHTSSSSSSSHPNGSGLLSDDTMYTQLTSSSFSLQNSNSTSSSTSYKTDQHSVELQVPTTGSDNYIVVGSKNGSYSDQAYVQCLTPWGTPHLSQGPPQDSFVLPGQYLRYALDMLKSSLICTAYIPFQLLDVISLLSITKETQIHDSQQNSDEYTNIPSSHDNTDDPLNNSSCHKNIIPQAILLHGIPSLSSLTLDTLPDAQQPVSLPSMPPPSLPQSGPPRIRKSSQEHTKPSQLHTSEPPSLPSAPPPSVKKAHTIVSNPSIESKTIHSHAKIQVTHGMVVVTSKAEQKAQNKLALQMINNSSNHNHTNDGEYSIFNDNGQYNDITNPRTVSILDTNHPQQHGNISHSTSYIRNNSNSNIDTDNDNDMISKITNDPYYTDV